MALSRSIQQRQNMQSPPLCSGRIVKGSDLFLKGTPLRAVKLTHRKTVGEKNYRSEFPLNWGSFLDIAWYTAQRSLPGFCRKAYQRRFIDNKGSVESDVR